MICQSDKNKIVSYAKKYKIKEVYLFGSSLNKDQESNDIDIGIKGVSPLMFFDFYGKLLRNLTKPIDIINLSKKSRFNKLIEKESIKIYG